MILSVLTWTYRTNRHGLRWTSTTRPWRTCTCARSLNEIQGASSSSTCRSLSFKFLLLCLYFMGSTCAHILHDFLSCAFNLFAMSHNINFIMFRPCSLWQVGDILLDYSKNRTTAETMQLLTTLAADAGVCEKRDAMFNGVNPLNPCLCSHGAYQNAYVQRPA